jgi:hypothetical protein
MNGMIMDTVKEGCRKKEKSAWQGGVPAQRHAVMYYLVPALLVQNCDPIQIGNLQQHHEATTPVIDKKETI